jgi:hypothetical protein
LAKSIEKNILPFAVSLKSENNFDENIEHAAVFCISETNREKGGGFLRKQNPEKIVFLSKIEYPFWLVPFRESTFLLDGLNISSHNIPYAVLPDLKAFKELINGKPMAPQVHIDFLSNNQNYFQNSGEEKKLTIDGLVHDSNFTSEFLNYLKEAKPTTQAITDAVLISPALDQTGLSSMLQKIEETRIQFSDDIDSLNQIIKLLNLRMNESKAALNKEIKATEAKFGSKIKKLKDIFDDRVAKLKEQYTQQLTVISNKYKGHLASLHTEVLKVEKKKNLLDAEIERAEAEIKTSSINKDDTTEAKWKKKRDQLKDRKPEITSQLKQLNKKIQEGEEAQKNALFQLKQDNDAKITEAGKDLFEVQAARDAEVKIYKQEIEKIEELTSNIIVKVDELAKKREQIVIEFDSLSIKQKKQEYSLIYMPFYIACYQTNAQKRYFYLAPSEVNGCGIGTRLKCIGKTKISQFFQPRYKENEFILNGFIKLLEENIVFNREISNACLQTNLLHIKKDQESIKNGLVKLQQQKWLSDREFEDFNKAVLESSC